MVAAATRELAETADGGRLVVVGRNSSVWKRLEPLVAGERPVVALGHADLSGFRFQPSDSVWIFAFSRRETENADMMACLRAGNAGRFHYISTATVNVAETVRCYTYPRVKARAEADARRLLDARIVRLGLVHYAASELPSGTHAATSLEACAGFILSPTAAAAETVNLFTMATRPFSGRFERLVFRLYARLIRAAGARPCLLRPIDLLLKIAGLRWYGYLFLSDELWLRNPPGAARPDHHV